MKNADDTEESSRPDPGGTRIEKLSGNLAAMRNRRFTRALVSYTLALWLVVQLADVGFPLLEVPDKVLALIIIGGILALPVVMTVAWIAELILDRKTRTPDEPILLRTALIVLLLLGVVSLASTATLSAHDFSAGVDGAPFNDCKPVPQTPRTETAS